MLSLIFNPWAWLVTLGLLLGSYFTGRYQQYQSDQKEHTASLLKATQEARQKEQDWQLIYKETTDAKESELRAVATERDRALASLRNRPKRLPEAATAACNGGTGAQLSQDDAGFLIRFATERDEQAAQLRACQGWIKAVTGDSQAK